MKRWALLGLVFLVACRAQEEAQAEDGEEGDEFAQKKWRDEVGKHSYCAEDNCYDLLGVTKVCHSPQRSPAAAVSAPGAALGALAWATPYYSRAQSAIAAARLWSAPVVPSPEA